MAEIETWQLEQRLALPLEQKIKYSIDRIMEWYAYWKGNVYGAFSGGLDSTVMMDLIWSIYPDVPAIFNNTGLEFPEIVDFVKERKKTHNIIILRPRKNFKQVIEEYGYPIVSKSVAQKIKECQQAKNKNTATFKLRTTGIKSDGTLTKIGKLPNKWHYLIDSPFKISDVCCKHLKKSPAIKYSKETGRMPYVGTTVGESRARRFSYLDYGCNAYTLTSQPRSTPIAIWSGKDIREYIKQSNLDYSKIYDMGYKRTGCIFCGFGVHMEKGLNRFQRLKQTHPALWKYCMDKLGLREVMKVYGVPIEENQMCLKLNENI